LTQPVVGQNDEMDDHEWPSTAEALMRSRFAAFRDADAEWLLASWHPSTRPSTVDLSSNPRWRGLQIVEVVDGAEDDETGLVEFRATYVAAPGDVRVLQERSRFIREDGRWYYLDATG
jgi:SEC-C motif-containing protein